MSDPSLPNTWDAAVRWFLGGTIVFALGFEGVTMLMEGKFLLCLLGIGLAVGLLGFMVYWPAGGGLLLLMAGLPALLFLGTIEACKRFKLGGRRLLTIGIVLLVGAVAFAGIGGALIVVSVSQKEETDGNKGQTAEGSSNKSANPTAKLSEAIQQRDTERQARQTLESQLTTAQSALHATQQQLEAARQSPAPSSHLPQTQTKFVEFFGPGPALDGKLTPIEARQMADVLTAITTLLNSKASMMRIKQFDALFGGPPYREYHWWTENIEKIGFAAAIELATTYNENIVEIHDFIEGLLKEHSYLEPRLRKIVGNTNVFLQLHNSMRSFIEKLKVISQENGSGPYKMVLLRMMLDPPKDAVIKTQDVAIEWMELFVKQRSPAARREINEFL